MNHNRIDAKVDVIQQAIKVLYCFEETIWVIIQFKKDHKTLSKGLGMSNLRIVALFFFSFCMI